MREVALLDLDVFVYRAAWATNDEDEAIAIRTFNNLVAEAVLIVGCADYQGYLSGKGNFRHKIAKTAPYKGNRKATKPPIHKNAIRLHAIEHWEALVTVDEEADDAIAIAATKKGKDNCVLVSIDKDFLQIEGRHFNPVKRTFKDMNHDEAKLFFYTQILTGDAIDNIIGLKGIGPVKGGRMLDGCVTEVEMFKACVDAYDGNVDRVIENARLLWLRREEGQLWEPPEA